MEARYVVHELDTGSFVIEDKDRGIIVTYNLGHPDAEKAAQAEAKRLNKRERKPTT